MKNVNNYSYLKRKREAVKFTPLVRVFSLLTPSNIRWRKKRIMRVKIFEFKLVSQIECTFPFDTILSL